MIEKNEILSGFDVKILGEIAYDLMIKQAEEYYYLAFVEDVAESGDIYDVMESCGVVDADIQEVIYGSAVNWAHSSSREAFERGFQIAAHFMHNFHKEGVQK